MQTQKLKDESMSLSSSPGHRKLKLGLQRSFTRAPGAMELSPQKLSKIDRSETIDLGVRGSKDFLGVGGRRASGISGSKASGSPGRSALRLS